MKKTVLIVMLAIFILMAGCANEEPDEIVNQGNTAAAQNNIVSNEVIDEYMTSVTEQSDAIKTYLQEEAMTQADMNLKSMELDELWNGAMNYLLEELKNRLSEDDFLKLQDDQLIWIAEKDKAVADAGAEFEGGSFYALVVYSESASITEKRVLELYEMLT